MKKLITKEDVNQIQFYKMPKAFFQNPIYMPLLNESKLAYMFMLDLLPLSLKNKWLNKNDEVFVKLSRTKLMKLLNIKSTQKAAKVMKELVEHELIIYKKVGLNKCNEIYLYPLEGASCAKAKAPKPKAPVSCNDVLCSENSDNNRRIVKERLKEQIHTEDLKQRYAPSLVDEIVNNICYMYFNTSTRVGKQDKPMGVIRSVISELKMVHIEHVIDQFIEASATVKIYRPKRYIQTLIYNSIYEANLRMTSHIKYNFGW